MKKIVSFGIGLILLVISTAHAGLWNTITKTINGNPGWAVVDDTGTNRLVIDSAGNVGIGTSSPTVLLEVAGAIRIGNNSISCGGGVEGTLRYNSTSKVMELCDGSTWQTLKENGGPTATNMSISGTEEVGKTLTGSYTYSDAESDPEGTTTLQWYTADDAQGTNQAAISGATNSTYTLTSSEEGKFVIFQVHPYASRGFLDGGIYSVATTGAIAQDTTPEAFTFTDQTNVNPSTLTSSNSVTITGITTGVSASVSGDGSPQIRINSGSWVSSGTITNGQTLEVRLTSSANYETANSVTVTVGNGSDNWSVTTRAQDSTPDAFTFSDQTGTELNTLITSNTITITGLADPASVSVSGNGSPQISIASGAWGTSGTINNNQSLQVRLTSSASETTAFSATITVGGVNDTWSVTTKSLTDGSSQASSGTNCRQILIDNPSAASGTYWLDPNGGSTSDAFQAYCDMTTDDGGWTFVVGISSSNGNHRNTSSVTPSNLTSPSGKGKFSDSVINSLKSGTSPAWRFTCNTVTAYFHADCDLASTSDASGACAGESYSYSPPSYGTTQHVQGGIQGLSDGSSGDADRLIYTMTHSGGGIGCDTAATGWEQAGTLYVR